MWLGPRDMFEGSKGRFTLETICPFFLEEQLRMTTSVRELSKATI